MNTVKWGIIGCGDVCERKSGPAFYKVENSELLSVMRRDKEKAQSFAKRHNVPRFSTNADELISDPDIDILYIATPPDTHKEYAIRAMQAGKAVYVEKPMALTYEECQEIINVSEETGAKLFVAFPRREIPYFLHIKEMIEKGEIGKVLTVHIRFTYPPFETDKDPQQHTWRIKKEIAGGGYFYDMAPHTLDVLDFMLGEIEDAKGFIENRAGLYDVEDTVSATFRFRSGVIGTGLWCFVSNEVSKEDTIEITGTEGRITFSTFAYTPICVTKPEGTVSYPYEPPEHSQYLLIQSIVNDLLGKGKCTSTGMSGARTAYVMDKICKG